MFYRKSFKKSGQLNKPSWRKGRNCELQTWFFLKHVPKKATLLNNDICKKNSEPSLNLLSDAVKKNFLAPLEEVERH